MHVIVQKAQHNSMNIGHSHLILTKLRNLLDAIRTKGLGVHLCHVRHV